MSDDYRSEPARAKLRASLRQTLLMMETAGVPRDVLFDVLDSVVADELLKDAREGLPDGLVGLAIAALAPPIRRISASSDRDPTPVLSAIATHLASILRAIATGNRPYAEALMHVTLGGVQAAFEAKGRPPGAYITISVLNDDEEEERKH